MTVESDWVRVFEADDVEARRGLWERAYKELGASVSGLARSVTGDDALASDVLQETFLAVSRYGNRFRGDGSLRGWILTIAANLARRILVRARAHRTRPAPPADAQAEPDRALMTRERAAAVRRALAALPPEQRMALSLSVIEGLKTEEIASILGCPTGTVWSRIHHAKRKLAETIARRQRGEDR